MMRTAAIIAACAACGPSAGRDHNGDDDTTIDGNTNQPPGDAAECKKIDVLFVIDNSGSMGDEQTNLLANFPTFVSLLAATGDYRVAVTTTGRDYTWYQATPIGNIPDSQDGGDNGKLLHPAACNMLHPWIDPSDPDPLAEFECVAHVGTSGPSEEMPLGAIADAFGPRMTDGTNTGFHRPDALLAVVVLTDENDCSYQQPVTLGFTESLCSSQMEPVATYKQLLDTYTGDPSRWAVAVIAGMGPGQCTSTFGMADEATRLKDFVNLIGPNAVMSSICDGDLSIGLMHALDTFASACGNIIL